MPCRSWGGGIPVCLAGLQVCTRREVEGSGLWGSPGPHPVGKLRGLAWGSLQAHTQGGKLRGLARGGFPGPHLVGGVSRPTPGGCVSPGPHPGISRPTHEGSPGPHPGEIPACTVADTPQQTGTAAGSTHPTGMHSCLFMGFNTFEGFETRCQ